MPRPRKAAAAAASVAVMTTTATTTTTETTKERTPRKSPAKKAKVVTTTATAALSQLQAQIAQMDSRVSKITKVSASPSTSKNLKSPPPSLASPSPSNNGNSSPQKDVIQSALARIRQGLNKDYKVVPKTPTTPRNNNATAAAAATTTTSTANNYNAFPTAAAATTTAIPPTFASPDDPNFDPNVYKQSKVAKYFDKELYMGMVTQCFELEDDDDGDDNYSNDPYKKVWCWHVVYHDGDEEDWDFEELQDGLKLYQKETKPQHQKNVMAMITSTTPTVQQQFFKSRDSPPTIIPTHDNTTPITNINMYLYSRVSKAFNGKLYFGMIVEPIFAVIRNGGGASDNEKDKNNKKRKRSTATVTTTKVVALWRILYDDGDAEDWDIDDVMEGIRLYQQNIANTNYDLWQIFDMDDIPDFSKSNPINPIPNLNNDNDKRKAKTPRPPPPPTEIRKNAERVIKFFLFVLERQHCWIRRRLLVQQQQQNNNNSNVPSDYYWTNSRVFREYYFCNNYRQLDRGTSFFHEHVVWLLWKDHNNNNNKRNNDYDNWKAWFEKVLWASYCYRLVNKIESFSKVGSISTSTFGKIPTRQEWPVFKKLVKELTDSEDNDDDDDDDEKNSSKKMKGSGSSSSEKKQKQERSSDAFFTGAHQTCSYENYLSWVDTIADEKSQKLDEIAKQASGTSLESIFTAINKNLPGCGTFLSWQILCDLMESNALPKIKTIDFCVLGNGAKAGIEDIFFANVASKTKGLKNDDYLKYAKLLVDHQDEIYRRLKLEDGIEVKFPKWRGTHSLTLKEIEHALCEFSKWQRIERSLLNGNAAKGQRLRKSRSYLDQNLSCRKCQASLNNKNTNNRQQRQHQSSSSSCCSPVILCNTCNQGYCDNCEPSTEKDPIYWMCTPCQEFEDFEWNV